VGRGLARDSRKVFMKSLRDRITEQNKRVVRAVNRPDLIRRDEGVLFHATGSSGWRRRRNHGGYKAGRSEHNFEHLHNLFTEEV
jgi:hypothetical protein